MKEIKYTVDKRTEIMSILLYISNYRKECPDLILFNKEIPYVKDVYEYFNKFAGHKAVTLLNVIVEKLNFNYDAPYALAMQLNEDLSLTDLLPYPFKSRLNSSPIVSDFMNEIQDFAKKSNFEEFYNNHQDMYNDLIKKFEAKTDFEYLSHFEEFYKIKTDKDYVVNLLPLCSRGGSFYDHRNLGKFILHLSNDPEGAFGMWLKYPMRGKILKLFNLCYLRRLLESNNFEIPETNAFAKIQKEEFTPINNVQYICGEIASVLVFVFKINYSKTPFHEAEVEEKIKSEYSERFYKAFKLILAWQKSDDLLEKHLQKVLDLYKD